MFDGIGGLTAFATLPAGDIRAALRAVLPAASKDKTRPHLAGVLLAFEERALEVVATDYHRLHRVTVEWPAAAEAARPGRLLVPRAAAEGLVKALGTAKACEGLTIAIGATGAALSDGRTLPFPAADVDEFPPHKRVIPAFDPKAAGGCVVGFNPAYLAEAAEAAAAIGANSVKVQLAGALDPALCVATATGDGGCVLRLDAVVMPMQI